MESSRRKLIFLAHRVAHELLPGIEWTTRVDEIGVGLFQVEIAWTIQDRPSVVQVAYDSTGPESRRLNAELHWAAEVLGAAILKRAAERSVEQQARRGSCEGVRLKPAPHNEH